MVMTDQNHNADKSLSNASIQIAHCKVMNTRRYLHHRVQKRKKHMEKCAIENNNSSVEEERQFKLKRFVQDVDQFVKEKELTSQKKECHKARNQSQKKKNKPAKPLVKRGLFQNGVQTQFYSRGALGRETTARLDEDLRQIIALANKENVCQCVHHCQQPHYQPTSSAGTKPCREPLKPVNLRMSPTSTSWQRTPSPPAKSVDCRDTTPDRHQSLPNLDELDSKLYLEVARIVTNSCMESMSKQFKNKSYHTAVKQRLLDIYLQGKKKNSQHSCCMSDAQSDRANSQSAENNSPLTQGQLGSATSHTKTTQDSDHTFKEINFISQPSKSTREFLEETLGPGLSWKDVNVSPELQQYHPPSSPPTKRKTKCHWPNELTASKYFHSASVSSFHNFATETRTSSHSWKAMHVLPELQQCNAPLSPPVRRTTKCHWPDESTGSKHLQRLSSSYNCSTSNVDDVWEDWIRLRSNNLNSFLPPVQDSPEFQYFPRRMF